MSPLTDPAAQLPVQPLVVEGAEARLDGPRRVTEVEGREAFAALREEWDALAERIAAPLFVRHDFLRLWIETFAPEAQVRVLLSRDAQDGLSAVLPLLELKVRSYGVPVRMLAAPTNDHSGRFDLLSPAPDRDAAALIAYLKRRPGWDVLRLAEVPVDGPVDLHLMAAAGRAGLLTGRTPGLRSPTLALPASLEAFEAARSKSLRSTLKRRRRQLEEKGAVAFERVSARDGELARKLEEAFALEASGWKGRAGTAILQDPATHAFYASLATLAAERDALSLWFLRVEGRALAFHLGIEDRGCFLSFKHGYDEGASPFSPGQVLTEHLLRDAVSRGLGEFDFMGDEGPAKKAWTDEVRGHRFCFVFNRTTCATALHLAKFRAAPLVRRVSRYRQQYLQELRARKERRGEVSAAPR